MAGEMAFEGRPKYRLTYSHMGMYGCGQANGTSGDNFGCIQRGGRAAAAGDFDFSGAAGTNRRGDRRRGETGAAVGVKTLASAAGCGSGECAAGRAAEVVSDQCGGDTADA